MQQPNIHYSGHFVQNFMNKSEIKSLITSTVMLGDLEKVSWVILKCGYYLQPFCDLENVLFDLNIQHPKQKNK